MGDAEGPRWAERIVTDARFAAPEFADHPARVSLLILKGLLCGGSHEAREALLAEGKATAERSGDEVWIAAVDFIRGEFHLAMGDSDSARRLFEAALERAERLKNPDFAGWCHEHLGWAALATGEPAVARDHFEQAVLLARSDPLGEWLEPHALAGLAPLVARAGDHTEATRLAEEAAPAACPRPRCWPWRWRGRPTPRSWPGSPAGRSRSSWRSSESSLTSGRSATWPTPSSSQRS